LRWLSIKCVSARYSSDEINGTDMAAKLRKV
jgi:hypothetical protein